MLNVVPLLSLHKKSNCAQAVFASVLESLNVSAMGLFASGWSFTYNRINTNQIFGECTNLYAYPLCELIKALQINCGISFNPVSFNNPSEYQNFIVNLDLSLHPMAMNVDSYFCNWQPGYKKHHCMHLVQILDFSTSHLICSDPYLNIDRAFIPWKDFEQGCKEVYFFEKTPKNNNSQNKFPYLGGVLDSLPHPSNALSQLAEFCHDLFYFSNLLNAELSANSPEYIQIIRNISHIAYGRICYAHFIEQYNISPEVSNSFITLGKMWSLINNKLIKYRLREFNPIILQEIISSLQSIIKEEKSLSVQLAKFFNV